jgi:hypothetical protein
MPLENISTVAIVEDMLPPATFHILLALADDDRHGYAIIQDIAARTDGELKLSAGTLYRSIQRMLEQGLILETRERPAPEEDDDAAATPVTPEGRPPPGLKRGARPARLERRARPVRDGKV